MTLKIATVLLNLLLIPSLLTTSSKYIYYQVCFANLCSQNIQRLTLLSIDTASVYIKNKLC